MIIIYFIIEVYDNINEKIFYYKKCDTIDNKYALILKWLEKRISYYMDK
jgi:hypothetical protein